MLHFQDKLIPIIFFRQLYPHTNQNLERFAMRGTPMIVVEISMSSQQVLHCIEIQLPSLLTVVEEKLGSAMVDMLGK